MEENQTQVLIEKPLEAVPVVPQAAEAKPEEPKAEPPAPQIQEPPSQPPEPPPSSSSLEPPPPPPQPEPAPEPITNPNFIGIRKRFKMSKLWFIPLGIVSALWIISSLIDWNNVNVACKAAMDAANLYVTPGTILPQCVLVFSQLSTYLEVAWAITIFIPTLYVTTRRVFNI